MNCYLYFISIYKILKKKYINCFQLSLNQIIRVKDSKIYSINNAKDYKFTDEDDNLNINYYVHKLLQNSNYENFEDNSKDLKILIKIFYKKSSFNNPIIKCDYEFILINLVVNNNTYELTNIINNYKNYYYIVNNILFDKIFINWFSLNHINIDYNNYNIYIIDHNANEIKLTNKQSIKLNKDNYKIINNI